jgi:hypothetical protein
MKPKHKKYEENQTHAQHHKLLNISTERKILNSKRKSHSQRNKDSMTSEFL